MNVWLEAYQTIAPTAAVVIALWSGFRMSWERMMIAGLAGLFFLVLWVPIDREANSAQKSVMRAAGDPACRTVDVTADGENVEKWVIVCPKLGRPL